MAERWTRLRHEAPDAYARRVIYNGAVSRWRRHRREAPTAALPEAGVQGGNEAWIAGADVRAALQALTPRQRQTLLDIYDSFTGGSGDQGPAGTTAAQPSGTQAPPKTGGTTSSTRTKGSPKASGSTGSKSTPRRTS